MKSCTPDTTIFATPTFLSTVLHTIGLIELPIHLFGAYIILSKTPQQMLSVKWPMFNLHFWSLSLDLTINLLTIPFVLFPEFAGFPLGILNVFKVPASLQVHLVVTNFGLLIVSMMIIYASRFLAIASHIGDGVRMVIKLLFAMSYGIAITFMIPFTIMVPEQEKLVEAVLERLPCLPVEIYNSPIFVYTSDFKCLFFTIATLFIICVITCFVYITLTVHLLWSLTQNGTFSMRTISLQKRFLFGLVVQTAIPIIGFCPVVYIAMIIPQSYYNQALNNTVFILFGSHGLLSTVTMLLIHKPYREACLDVVSFQVRKTEVTRIQVAEKSIVM